MKAHTLLRTLLGLCSTTFLCFMLPNWVIGAVVHGQPHTLDASIAQTTQTFLPFIASTAPAALVKKSGFGAVTLSSVVNRAAVQDGNTIIVAATVIASSGSDAAALPSSFAVARYFLDGSLDRSFGDEGHVITHFENRSAAATALAVQSDGKIIVVGYTAPGSAYDPSGEFEFALVRYHANGTLDSSFSQDGKLTADFIPDNNDFAFAVAIQEDGKLLVVGNTVANDNTLSASNSVVARFNPDGLLDNTFGEQGKLIADFGGYDLGKDVALLTNRKIVVVGDSCCAETSNGFALSRYHPDGTADTTFGNAGHVVTELSEHPDSVSKVLLQPDGKMLVAGCSTTSFAMSYELARYDANGTLDPTFGDNGKVILHLQSEFQCTNDVALQDDGKIVIAGYAASIHGGCQCHTILLRYNSDGTLDESFDGDGIVAEEFSDLGWERANALLLAADQKILMIGVAADYVGPTHLIMARYNTDGSRDHTFVFRP